MKLLIHEGNNICSISVGNEIEQKYEKLPVTQLMYTQTNNLLIAGCFANINIKILLAGSCLFALNLIFVLLNRRKHVAGLDIWVLLPEVVGN